jgi:hypothetical protein
MPVGYHIRCHPQELTLTVHYDPGPDPTMKVSSGDKLYFKLNDQSVGTVKITVHKKVGSTFAPDHSNELFTEDFGRPVDLNNNSAWIVRTVKSGLDGNTYRIKETRAPLTASEEKHAPRTGMTGTITVGPRQPT